MRVLNLITDPNVPPYKQQVETLRRQGVEETTLGVPGDRWSDDGESSSRSVLDYVRFYPTVLRHSFGDYDLVHASYGLTAPAALAQPNLPVVVSLWGSDLFGRFGRLSQVCARLADAVIVMSPRMADALHVDCHVIPHGVDLELFGPMPRAEAREAIDWPVVGKRVLFPYPVERPEKDYPRAQRVVEAAEERLDEAVTLHALELTPHERMPLYMNASDAMLLTSQWEGSPNTVKEAMACNLPVVSTDVGDVRERLSGVDPSAVGRTDEELVAGLVDVLSRGEPSNGRRAIEPLGLEQMGRRIRVVYESVR